MGTAFLARLATIKMKKESVNRSIRTATLITRLPERALPATLASSRSKIPASQRLCFPLRASLIPSATSSTERLAPSVPPVITSVLTANALRRTPIAESSTPS